LHKKYEFRIKLQTDSGFEYWVDNLTLVVGCGFENDGDLTITPNALF